MVVRILLASVAVAVVAAVASFSYVKKSTAGKYRDGVYEGSSQSIYTSEEFWGKAEIEISKRQIARVDFSIVDEGTGRKLDLKYCSYAFGSNPEYLRQCHHDSRGMRTYTQALMKAKDLKKVHAVAGATWSYDIFKASAGQALAKAK